MARVSGTVKFFNTDKGYGFILGPASKEESKVESEDKKEGEEESKEESQQQDKQQEYFVHFSAIEGEGFKSLASGEVVEYELELNPSTGKMCAVRVTGPGGAPVQGAPPQMKGGACGGGKGGKGMKGGFPGMMPFPDACGGKGFGGGGKSGGKKGGKGKGKGGKGKGFNGFGDQAYMYGGDAFGCGFGGGCFPGFMGGCYGGCYPGMPYPGVGFPTGGEYGGVPDGYGGFSG
mmetsp:Transcript_86837/g.218609  ORF Transcript_86837/g.218609 Transcript_86837/m.218609 type:complete len:232 (+) Transcript_86837:179-874(+)